MHLQVNAKLFTVWDLEEQLDLKVLQVHQHSVLKAQQERRDFRERRVPVEEQLARQGLVEEQVARLDLLERVVWQAQQDLLERVAWQAQQDLLERVA